MEYISRCHGLLDRCGVNGGRPSVLQFWKPAHYYALGDGELSPHRRQRHLRDALFVHCRSVGEQRIHIYCVRWKLKQRSDYVTGSEFHSERKQCDVLLEGRNERVRVLG